MKAEPPPVSVPILQQPTERFRSAASGQSIQACYDLISSGHSLSEILIALKELGPLNKAQPDLVDTSDSAEVSQLIGAVPPPPQWEILQVPERVEVSRTLVPLNVEPQQRPCNVRKSRLLAVALFWLIPAMSLVVMGISGRLLIDAGLLRNSGSATKGAEATIELPAITEVGRSASERNNGAITDELAVTASPTESATQAVVAAPD